MTSSGPIAFVECDGAAEATPSDDPNDDHPTPDLYRENPVQEWNKERADEKTGKHRDSHDDQGPTFDARHLDRGCLEMVLYCLIAQAVRVLVALLAISRLGLLLAGCRELKELTATGLLAGEGVTLGCQHDVLLSP